MIRINVTKSNKKLYWVNKTEEEEEEEELSSSD